MMRNTRLLLGVVVLVVMSIALVYGVSALATYATRVYMEQGGDRMVVDNGGTIEIQNGGTLEIRSGAVVNVNTAATFGSDITDKMGFKVLGNALSGVATAKTSNYVLNATDDVKLLITNAGVTSATEVTRTLAAAAPGVRFAIAGVVDGATVDIIAPSGDLVYGWMSSAGKTLRLVGQGYMTGIAVDATNYAVLSYEGTWTQID